MGGMKLFLSLLLAASPASSAPVLGAGANARIGSPVSPVPAARLIPSLTPSLDPLALPALGAGIAGPSAAAFELPALPEPLAAPSIPSAAAPSRLSLAPAAVPAARTAIAAEPSAAPRRESLLARLARGFRGALSLPSVFDNAAVSGFNGADAPVPDDSARARMRDKPDRRSPRTAERAAFELKLEAEALHDGLAAIHDLAKRAKDAPLRERKTELLARLTRAYESVEAASVLGVPYGAASSRLRALHAERERLAQAQDEASRAENGLRLDALNESAIGLERSILKTQLGVAILQLTGKARLASKEARRNAALWTLRGAYNTAASLHAEVRYKLNRERLREKRRETLTIDAFGRPVRVFDLEGFDIEIFPPVDGGEAVVTIRQHRWRNALAMLAAAGRDARNGRAAAALRRLDAVLSLYTADGGNLTPRLRRDYAEIAEALAAARDAAARLVSARAPPEEAVARASALIAAVAERITRPKLSAPEDVAYDGLDKALRSQAHTLAGNLDESTRILRVSAELEFWRDLLNAALRPGAGRPLTPRERRRMLDSLETARAWAARGKVRPKQSAAQALSAARDAAERGDFETARTRLQDAYAALAERIRDLDSISSHVRRRAAALYAEYRDRDLLARLRRMTAGSPSTAEAALSMREQYALESLPEPGYRRAAKKLEAYARAIAAGERAKAAKLLAGAREDVEHKRSFEVSIRVRPSKESRRISVKTRFVNPGTTLGTLLGRIGGRRERPRVRIDGGEWLSFDEIPRSLRLDDETVVDLII